MKYIKLFEQFLITENLNPPQTPKTVYVEVELKNFKLSKHWTGTIFEVFEEAYKFCKDFDLFLESIRKKEGSNAKQMICQKKHKELWKLISSTADHQVHVLKEKYPAGMPPLDPEIGQSSNLLDKIQTFLDSKPPKYILDDTSIEGFNKKKISDLPTTLFREEAKKFADKIISEEPGSSDIEERSKKLTKFISKVKMHNWEQRTANKWDEKLVISDPNYSKSQEMFGMVRKWTKYCEEPPKDKFKFNNISNTNTNTDSPSVEDSTDLRRAQY